MKKSLFIFVFFLSAIRYPLSAIFAAPPHPLIYDTGPLTSELQALVARPRISVPIISAEHVAQRAGSTGTVKVVALLIEFADTKALAGHSKSHFDNLLFSRNQGFNSMYDYFNEVSETQLNVTGTTGSRWYQSSKNMSYYGADGSKGIDSLNIDISNLVIEAVQKADADINFAPYDTDGDGIVNHVIIIHAGHGQEDTGDTNNIWSHSGSFTTSHDEKGYLTNDGVHVKNYTMLSEYSPVGTFAHEFGHDLGLPDFYYTQPISGNPTMVGDWDLMDGGAWLGPGHDGSRPAHIGAWGKKFLGWITPTDLTQKELAVPVTTTGNQSVYKIPLVTAADPSQEYILIEYRRKENFDLYLPGEGLLIWHIDDAMLDYKTTDFQGNHGKAIDLNVVNSEPDYVPHRAVDLIEADKTDKTSQPSDPFPGTQSVTNFLSPDNDAYNRKPSQFSVLNISSAGGASMSFDIYQAVFTKLPEIAKIYSYPNPSATGQTRLKIITTNLVETKSIDLKIYEVNGELIREAKTGEISQVAISDNRVEYEYAWNGRNENGEKVASGIYLYWFKVDNKEKVGKIAIIK
ncbi:MAG: M6 family metalloprotease domain-containing protein [Elusimicrobia bacterium]|nr:M6 family metalloprotease domain-containing protein [Elusimicrobiota bacterium]